MPKKSKKRLEDNEIIKFIAPILWKIVIGGVSFIIAFNFSYNSFFAEEPLFGIPLLAELLISFAAALFGFHTIPRVFFHAREWLVWLIKGTVADIVYDFWDQQSKKMQDSRRSRQHEAKKIRLEKDKAKLENTILLDTSILIDGRIIDIVKTGFLDSKLIVPQPVIDELHLISDNDDKLKRQRGRRGLDLLNKLKKITKVEIYKLPKEDKMFSSGVDKGLVEMAKKFKTRLMTLDFNLNKVASVANIQVLNINDLTNAVKAVVLPGEIFEVEIIQKGKSKNQGVGYLPDGTMIVVDDAKDNIGETLSVKVSKVIQTPAGKMIFSTINS